MDTIGEFLKSMNSKNEIFKGITGFSNLQGIAMAVAGANRKNFDLRGIKNITNIARANSFKTTPINLATMPLGMAVQLGLQNSTKNNALFGLTSSLATLARTNQLASDRLSGFAASRLVLASRLSGIATALNQPYLKEFNIVNTSIKSISDSYLQNVVAARNWEDISVAEQANETIANVAEELTSNTTQVTVQDLENFKQSIISELFILLGKTKTEKARQFIFDLITLIGFILTLYGSHQQHIGKTNEDFILETKIEIKKINSEFSKRIEFELSKLNKTRIARKNVPLKYACKKNTKVIGFVKIGQQVTVIETRNKYLLISYIDIQTTEPKSGFVLKKYFDIEKQK